MAPCVRDATPADWPGILPIFREVVEAQRTFPYAAGMHDDEARGTWWVDPPGRTTVAETDDGTITGTAHMEANRGGRGAHIATASFMVPAAHAGHGIGRALATDAIAWARARSFHGMQFNAVVETNAPAVALYRSLGFAIVGTVPGAFDHPDHGYVGLHVMYLPFTAA